MTNNQAPDCTIVVTRPAQQAAPLLKKLQGAGICSVHFPVIKINAIKNQQKLLDQVKNLGSYDIAIFISRNAADYGMAVVNKTRLTEDWPVNTRIATIGHGTASQLQKRGLKVDILARGNASSETLLSEQAMQSVAGKRILIFRGNGGREKLADTLRERGAYVDYLECYERSPPHIDAGILTSLWDRNSLDGIILTSAEGLKNLYLMVKKEDLARLNTTPLFVISSTMVELCGKLGYKLKPILMSSAADDDVLESVVRHCRSR